MHLFVCAPNLKNILHAEQSRQETRVPYNRNSELPTNREKVGRKERTATQLNPQDCCMQTTHPGVHTLNIQNPVALSERDLRNYLTTTPGTETDKNVYHKWQASS